jgi:hypothetical protein
MGVDFFRPFLWGERAAQGLVAAQVLAQNSGALKPNEQLRVAILIDREHPPPEISSHTLSVWLTELQGPHRLKAQRLAENSGESALLLWSVRDQLPDVGWLLELTENIDPERARIEATALLSQGALHTVQTALRLGLQLPASLLESHDPEVRAVAISNGLADPHLESYLNASLEEAVAAVPRCTSQMLLDLLADARWQVRSSAVRTLALGQERPVEEVRARLLSGSMGERVAAVALLQQWNDHDWLEAQLTNSV